MHHISRQSPATTGSLLLALLVLVLATSFAALSARARDAYHTWLVSHLEDEYGLSGGSLVLGDAEAAVLGLRQLTGITGRTIEVEGQPFTLALEMTVAQAGPDPWSRTVRFPIREPIANGDALLLVAWFRGSGAEGGLAHVEPLFEMTTDPYDKDFSTNFDVGDEWQQVLIPFEASRAYAVSGGRVQVNIAGQLQEVALGGLALLNYRDQYDVDDLPSKLPEQTYGGRELNAVWRAAAQDRIARYRMGDLTVRLQDENGGPVEGAEVRVRMVRPEFGFGSAVSVSRMRGSGSEDQMYRQKLADLTGDGRTFSTSVIENGLKWPSWENPTWPGNMSETVGVVHWLKEHGMSVRGHNLVWPGWQYLPSDMQANQHDPEYLRTRLRDRILNMAGYPGIKGEILEWDVINEAVHNRDLANALPEGEEAYVTWFNLAHEADPDAGLFLNEYNIISRQGIYSAAARAAYRGQIRALQDAGAPITGIGIQGHIGNALTAVDSVFQVLEELAQFGLDISITEFDISGVEQSLAAEYTRDLLTISFSHPRVRSFLMWGFWDGAHWHQDAPIFARDWSIKPTGRAYLDLVFGAWWTDDTVTTGADGTATIRAFRGDYEITATEAGATFASTATLSGAGEESVVEVTLTPTGTESDDRPSSFGIEGIYPNPFNPHMSVVLTLVDPGEYEVEVFDLLGRTINMEYLLASRPGTRTVHLDLVDQPSGVYLVVARHSGTGRMDSAKAVLLR